MFWTVKLNYLLLFIQLRLNILLSLIKSDFRHLQNKTICIKNHLIPHMYARIRSLHADAY